MPVQGQLTIKHVAQAAGVSTQTVSRVLNDRPDVSPETRQRVQEVITELGYQPSAIARSLSRQRSLTLGVVIAELGQYGPTRRLIGMKEAADELGYSLRLSLEPQPEITDGEQIIAELLSWQVDGIIWAVPEVGGTRAWLLQKIADVTVPIVFISEQPLYNEPAISINNRAGGYMATQHLVSQGYRNIGLITGPMSWVASQQRKMGWQDALPHSSDNQVYEGDWSAASGALGLRHLLANFPQIDAVFAFNDQMALGVLQTAHEAGLRVPEDLGVIGFDHSPESAYYHPPLTTIRHRLAEQGKIAVQQLVQMIETKQKNKIMDPSEITVLQPKLVVRKSTMMIADPEKG